MIRTYHHDEFDADRLAAAKGDQLISVCLPARNEESTVGPIVECLRAELVEDAGLVDEIIVVDDHSSDRTADVAASAGAKVVAAEEILPGYGEGHGKGEAMWKSLHVAIGDIIVWLDADVVDFGTGFALGLIGPLLHDPDLVFVKGFYDRPLSDAGAGGGRVTELVARPVISLLFPHLSPIVQPLAGEYAGRRAILEQLPFVQGYGVDLGLLIDIAALAGVERIAQADLGVRRHRNRPLDELSPQAMAVLHTALRRADPALAPGVARLVRPGVEPVVVDVDQRPALVTIDGHRRTRSA